MPTSKRETQRRPVYSKSKMRYHTAMKKLIIVALLALEPACGAFYSDTSALYPGSSPTQQALREVCGRDEGGLCVTVEQLAKYGIAQDVYWGRLKRSEFGFAALDPNNVIPLDKLVRAFGLDPVALEEMKIRFGLVIIEGKRCNEKPVTCRGVIRHEFGHLRRGPSQIEADCYAARTGTDEEVKALLALVSTFNAPERYQSFSACAKK
ncbi:hypothetical protein LCGC14_2183310 [marine sediment metagenome]|uniref:Uncharacterized protein n=1 Tax=marine sediment metagenome TaxID=412755 RepID=A0A0F9GHE9_9ZZZZ